MSTIKKTAVFAVGLAGGLVTVGALPVPQASRPPALDSGRPQTRSSPFHRGQTVSLQVASVVERGDLTLLRLVMAGAQNDPTYTLSVDVLDVQDQPIASASTTTFRGATGTVALPQLPDGAYSIIATLTNADGTGGASRWPWRRRAGVWSPIPSEADFANVAFEGPEGAQVRDVQTLSQAD